jgi:hypothetical protein
VLKRTATGWEDRSGNLPSEPVNTVAVDSRTNPSTLYAGTRVGVFVSRDEGLRWELYGQGLPRARVTKLILRTDWNLLFAGTDGRGAWRICVQPTD